MRYLVPIVLAFWLAFAALGCDWVWPWLILLVPAGAAQIVATARLYRDHHRRLR